MMYLVTELKIVESQEIHQLKEVSHIRLRRSPTKSGREQKMKKCISWVRNKTSFIKLLNQRKSNETNEATTKVSVKHEIRTRIIIHSRD